MPGDLKQIEKQELLNDKGSSDAVICLDSYLEQDSGHKGIPPCCRKTIDMQYPLNSMMVCPECRNIVKCFTCETEFKNFLRFCESKNRHFVSADLDGFYCVCYQRF